MKCNKKALVLFIVSAWVQSFSFQRSEWPRWSGPTDRLIATSKGIELIDDYQQAREIWRSERIPTAHGNYGGDHTNKLPSSGGASPILYNGKVYFNYYAPSPDSKKGEVMGYRIEKQPEWSKRILADEVILCLDMADGRTLWKKVFKEKGINIQDMKSPGRIHFTPVAFNGKIYALGTTARLYCVDANTGDLVWESQIPGYFEQCEQIVSEALADGEIVSDVPVGGRRTGHNLNFVKALDHVIVTISDDIFAYNGSTGDLVWKKTDHAGLIGPHANPVEWKGSDGNHYLLCTGWMGLVCLDAGDGSVQWELPGGAHDVNCYVDGDVVVFGRDNVYNTSFGDDLIMLQGYRLKVDGPELLWTHSDTALGYKIHYQGVAKDGYLYYPLIRTKRPEGSTEKHPPRNDSSVCILMETGERVKSANTGCWSQSIFMSAEDRLFHCVDFSHCRQEFFFMHPGPDFRMMGGIWQPAHAQTTSKHNAALMTPYADGYIYIRTALGIHCYDIRKNPPKIKITSPQHNSESLSGPLTLNCTIEPGESAVEASAIYVNGIKREERQGAINSWTLPDLAAGVHHIRIDIEDDKTISSDWVVISIGDESQKITDFPFKVDLGSTQDRSIGAPMPGFPADQTWVPGAAYGYVENKGRFVTEAVQEDKTNKPFYFHSWVRMGSLNSDTPLRYRIRLDEGDYYLGFTYFSETNDIIINGQAPTLESKMWSIVPEQGSSEDGTGDPNIQFPMTTTPEPVTLSSGINEISFSGAVCGFIIDTKPIETIDVEVHAGDRCVMPRRQEDISFSIRNSMLYISGRANAPVEITLFNVCGRRMGHWRLPANRNPGMIVTPMAKGAYFATVKAESRTIHRLIHTR